MASWVYWIGFCVYVVVVLTIGWRQYRKRGRLSSTSEHFWTGGRSFGVLGTGFSISASFMSISWSCVYAAQLAYWYGVSALWLLAIPWLVVMGLYFVVTPVIRKTEAFSQPEMIAKRFGPQARLVIALPLAFVFLVWGGAEMFVAAQILTPLLNIPFVVVLACLAAVVGAYSFMGGFSAVVKTDKLQFLLVAFFILSVSWMGLKAVMSQHTLTEVLSTIPLAPKTGQSALSLIAITPVLVVMTFVAYLPGWMVETDIWIRIQAATSTAAARKGVVVSILNSFVFVAVLPVLIGLCALVLYPPMGSTIPAQLNDGAAIFSLLIRDHTPTLLGVVLLVGLMAASMSTIDTCGNILALSLSYDVLEPWVAKRYPSLNRQQFARMMSAGAIGLAFVYAVFIESLWDIFYLSSGILTTTLFVPMVALWRRNVSPTQIIWAATSGFFGTFLFYFLESRGALTAIEPRFLSETGLGYILWGALLGCIGFVLGAKRARARQLIRSSWLQRS